MGRLITAAGVAAVLMLGGCGDEDVTGPQPIPAAGAQTPMETPGVPSGSSYDVNANEWLELDDATRLEATEDFIGDNPADCSNGDDRSAAADPVRDYADATIGTDYPLTSPMAELLAEGCAAALQSGTQDLAPAAG